MIQAPKGTKDILPEDSYLWQWLEEIMRSEALLAGYSEIRTPVFEHTELFQRGVGDTTDIVQKEMYTFLDKGKRSITLKPEGTAGVVRALIENRLYANAQPTKVYYLNCPIFRYENPQSGRLREHHQFGMECFGAPHPTAEAELIVLLINILNKLGLSELSVNINSIGCKNCRPKYYEKLLEYLKAHSNELCPLCNERMERNPLRVLDCKEEKCGRIAKNAPLIIDYLCDECSEHFAFFKQLLESSDVPFKVDPFIVRGLDYYTKTVFEIIMQTDREGLALCGGGRYDYLVEELGGPDMCGVGFGLGMERILMELKNKNVPLPEAPKPTVYVINISKEDLPSAFKITRELRNNGISADCDHLSRSMRAQFKFANKLSVSYVLMVGGDEAKRGAARLRDMATGEEKEILISDISEYILNGGEK
ncbi:MAG TPA: histidine--tRNA ligase [Christensenellaceae bacterium]|nr:histidine--tRNA ligase [Christensenellaceae bacterium]